MGTGQDRQVLAVRVLVYWWTGCDLRTFPIPAEMYCVSSRRHDSSEAESEKGQREHQRRGPRSTVVRRERRDSD